MKNRYISVILLVFLSSVVTVFLLYRQLEKSAQVDAETVRFTWWGDSDRNDAYIAAIRRFEEDNPEIKVDYEYYPWEDYFSNLISMTASDRLPDVFQMDIMYLADFSYQGRLADLQPYVDQNHLQTADISKKILYSGRIEGKLYGYTATINGIAMIVNSELVKAAGEVPLTGRYTFDDWIEQMIRISEKTGKIAYVDNGDVYVLLQYYLQTLGQDLVTYQEDRPVIGFDDASFKHFFDSFRRLAQVGGMVSPEVVASYKNMTENPLVNGEGVYQLNWAQMIDRVDAAASQRSQVLQLLSPFSGEKSQPISVHPGMQFSVNADSQVKESAVKLMDYLVNDAGVIVDYLRIERGLPTNQSVVETLLPTLSDTEKNVADYVGKIQSEGQVDPVLPPQGMAQMYRLLNQLFDSCVTGKISSEEALETYKENFESAIRQTAMEVVGDD